MTAAEFISTLREKLEVDFEEGMVSAPVREISDAIADSLNEILSPDETVVYGVQTASFGDESPGALVWLLVLRTDVLQVKVEIAREQNRRTFQINYHFFPIHTLEQANVEFKYPENIRVSVKDVHLSLNFKDQVIEARSGPNLRSEALSQLLSHVFARRPRKTAQTN